MASSLSAPQIDFEGLLTRGFRPANLSRVIPRDVLKRSNKAHRHDPPKDTSNLSDDDDDHDDDDDDDSLNGGKNGDRDGKASQTDATSRNQKKSEADEETIRLVMQLVSKTPIHQQHFKSADNANEEDEAAAVTRKETSDNSEDGEDGTNGKSKRSFLKPQRPYKQPTHVLRIPSKFHQVELSDWENKIEWDGYKKPDAPASQAATQGQNQTQSQLQQQRQSADEVLINRIDPQDLLAKKRNPFLEDISGTLESMISWSGSRADAMERIKNQPLVLELGVAGRSVSKQLLPSHRPLPAVKSEEYQNRIQANWKSDVTTAELNSRSLQTDREKMARFIAQQQAKRRQMAKDKTDRVKDALGTLGVLGSGKGRTITSSLMGPGGTERTGRPSRHVGNAIHDTEYIEQLDMVSNHVLFRDLSKVSLRQYHRPKLPMAIVRTTLIWQFQIRYNGNTVSKSKMSTTGQGGENSSSYQAMMMGTHPGAVSKAKLRTEADLSPTEGNLILLEFSEERPPIQMTKGMSSKIVTYYRGDKSRCPVSAGGGDRPVRRKRPGTESKTTKDESSNQNKFDSLPKLVGPDHALTATTMKEWVGKIPKKTREERNENAGINVLPEGITEILHPKVHGPFIGEIEHGQAVTGLISNLFVAPLFGHEPEQTDFLMILGRNSGVSMPGRHESLGVVLRELPSSVFTVGQTEPRARVYAPNTQGEKNFVGPFVSYQIAKALSRAESREGHGLRFDEIQHSVLPNLGLQSNSIRQRLKLVATYDKNTQIWTSKPTGVDDYPGVDALGKQIPAEGVAAFEVASATVRRLNDLGIHQLFAGSHATSSVGVAMIYLAGQVNAAKELARKFKKLHEASKSAKHIQNLQLNFYERVAADLDTFSKTIRQKHEVAKFIYEELQLASWHITGEFIDVHKKGEGTGMMKLTGMGDPSGVGDAFNFLREVNSKPSKSLGAGAAAQTAQMKKITGTDDDLRKLTMNQMARILRSYGMVQKKIDTLKRWDRVHVIRDLSTKNASDGMSDGLERFARGEKMKLSEQKQMYRDRIKIIWKRQVAALSMADAIDGRAVGGDGVGGAGEADDAAPKTAQQQKNESKEESDSESEDDDFIADLEEEMMDRPEANQLVMAQARDKGGMGGDASLGRLRNAAQDQDLTKDAREYAALKRQQEEERAAREGMSSTKAPAENMKLSYANRKVIRKKVTKTFPDGTQTTTFQFIVKPDEVGKIMARLEQVKEKAPPKPKERPEYQADDRLVGHAQFEDEDDFEYNTRGRRDALKRRGGRRGRSGAKTRKNEFQFGKLKNKVTKEQRMKKRRREEEEAELYTAVSKRKGTSNRKERGSIRERRPHVIMADRLESIRSMIESRPSSGAFVKPVNRREIPKYYEVISNPIDLSTIRDRIQKYEYRTVDAFLKDFELMKSNALKFNGSGSMIAEEGAAIYQLVKDKADENRGEFEHLAVAVEEQMNGKPKKRKKKDSAAKSGAAKINLSMSKIPDNLNLFEDMSDDSGND